MSDALKKCIGIVIPIFMAVFIVWVMTGCTTYTVEKTADSTIVKVRSTRSFEQPDLHYAREGNNAEFDFNAASASDDTVEVMSQMMQMWQMFMGSMMGFPMPPAPAAEDP